MAGFEAHDGRPGPRDHVGDRELIAELERLEEVGDLHFHAAAYRTALDYYGRLLPDESLARLDPAHA